MKNTLDEKILEEANLWIKANHKVALATVVKTWGSSPRQVGSKMIVNEKGDFSGSISGGCVESSVVGESIQLIKDDKLFKIIELKVSNENAWEVGLACGGEITIYLEQINQMKKQLLELIINKKKHKEEFTIITNISTGESCIFEKNKPIDKNFEKHSDEINNYFNNKQSGIIENTNIFIDMYLRPIKVIIVGAVHIAQYLVDYSKNLNFEIFIIDPRGYFASEKRFPNMNIVNKWPKEAFEEIETDSSTALIALTHDPKIDDPALQHALKNKFFYIGALGSKKTHINRCNRLKEAGYSEEGISSIHGPIGLKLGGKSAPEIALSITAQLVLESHKL